MTFATLSLRTRLAAAPVVAAVGFGALLLIGIGLGGQSIDALTEIEKAHYPRVELDRDLQALLQAAQQQLRDSVASEDLTDWADADAIRTEFLARLQRADDDDVISVSEGLTQQREFIAYYDLAKATSLRVVEVGFDESVVESLGVMRGGYNALSARLEKHTRLAKLGIEDGFDRARSSQRLFLMILAGTLVVCTTLLTLLAFYVSRSVSIPLSEIMTAVEHARHGDLAAAALPANGDDGRSGDEIAALRRGFQAMISALREMVGDASQRAAALREVSPVLLDLARNLQEAASTQEAALCETSGFMDHISSASVEAAGNSESLAELAKVCASAVAELDHSIGETAASIDQRHEEVESGASAVIQMTHAITELAGSARTLREEAAGATSSLSMITNGVNEANEAAEQTGQLAVRVRDRAADGLARVGESDSTMREIEGRFENLSSIVDALSGHSRSISDVTEVIDSIAHKTSLLALNASIISAQAGERGRAFAVVAEEIKKLSEQTAGSTAEIRAMIGEVTASIDEVVAAAGAGKAQVRSGVSKAEAASSILREIHDAAVSCAQHVEGIVSRSSAQRQALGSVDEVVRRVENTALEFDSGMQEQTRAAVEVKRAIGEMSSFADLVRVAAQGQRTESQKLAQVADDVSVSSSQIAAAVNEQEARSVRVRQALEDLASEIVDNRDRATRIGEAVDNLSECAEELGRRVERFST